MWLGVILPCRGRHPMSATTALTQIATNVDEQTLNGERVIDFDVDANSDYEIQSCVMVDDDNHVVEAAVRFGRVQERPNLGIGKPILDSAWTTMVNEHADADAIEADLSDFSHLVPHLRVDRENVEDYGVETVTLDEFAALVSELAELVENVLRGDDQTIDQQIDEYL